MTIWTDFGFIGSPYDTEPIPPTDQGDSLLVGRDREINEIVSRLESSTRHPTVEGPFGAGKTSLISVACYRLERAFKEGNARVNPLIPLRGEPIELNPEITIEDFQRKLFYRVAEAFKIYGDGLEATGRRVPRQKDIERWLMDPVFHTRSGGFSTPIVGISAGKGRTPSSSIAYSEFGFPRAMKDALESCFPSRAHGGFIAVVDNLELMRTSLKVRALLDVMRDNVLAQKGVRWILCGAQGVIRSAAATPRLMDRLAQPVDVEPISDDLMSEVIGRRIDAYKLRADPVTPVGPNGFWYLYDVVNRNLRTALGFADEFSFYLHRGYGSSTRKSDDLGLLEAWLSDSADGYHRAAEEWLGERDWRVFDILTHHGGTCRPCDDYQDFDYASAESLRAPIKSLREANLLTYEPDELNKRRKVASITATGWLVAYARAGYAPTLAS
ncbi:hypothetical protein [Streptomyces graminilatus]|uniref:hypothetical protein n=1 Tax=Streptomyces graminilatus TaxID=1464070 RepID=UPI000B02608B|nr:hypothetical protein [Streptomyces graminilatus]